MLIILHFISILLALPINHKIALANSLIVGKTLKEINSWTCGVCTENNKPLKIVYAR